jgi:D-tyrosyl-tRNA(Tyr) deacylase
MRAVLQRVLQGDVSVNGQTVGQIDTGLVALVGVTHGDGPPEAEKLARKVAHLRVFEDQDGKMNLSALEVEAAIMAISQFTLYADCRRGRRPSFTEAAPPDAAEPLVERFISVLREMGVTQVEKGLFGQHMLVRIHNNGPVTIILDTDEL